MPTGQPVDAIALEDGREVQVSIVDAATPCVFIAAESLGLHGDELPPAIGGDRALIETIGEIQARAGERIGLYAHWRDVHLPGLPLAVIVAPAGREDSNLRARLVFLGKCHDSMAGTGSICTAAASRIPGTLVHAAAGDRLRGEVLRIGHPLGVMAVKVVAQPGAALPRFTALGLQRTARRLMEGVVYVPSETA